MAVNDFTLLPNNTSCRLDVHMLKIMLKAGVESEKDIMIFEDFRMALVVKDLEFSLFNSS